ncbi:hypothetical protein D3C87_1521170 [compost metagenome]
MDRAVEARVHRQVGQRGQLGQRLVEGVLQGLGKGHLQQAVHVLEVQPELIVKELVLARVVAFAEPPVPVAALGDVNLLARLRPARNAAPLLGGEGFARLRQKLPGTILGRISDPGREVRVDPRAAEQVGQGLTRRVRREVLADCHHLERRVIRNLLIEAAQELGPVLGVVLPAVLTVQGDGHQMRRVADALLDAPEAADQIVGRLDTAHLAVREADEIREHDVTEDHGDLLAFDLHPVRLVEGMGI